MLVTASRQAGQSAWDTYRGRPRTLLIKMEDMRLKLLVACFLFRCLRINNKPKTKRSLRVNALSGKASLHLSGFV